MRKKPKEHGERKLVEGLPKRESSQATRSRRRACRFGALFTAEELLAA